VEVERCGQRLRDAVQRDEELVGRRQPRDLVPGRLFVPAELVDEPARERAEHTAEEEQDADLGRRALHLRSLPCTTTATVTTMNGAVRDGRVRRRPTS